VTQFEEDEYLFRAHEEAKHFFLIVEGNVALKVQVPHAGPIPIQTVSRGQVLGWSWLVPPYKWHFDARAFTPVTAVLLDVEHLRQAFEKQPELGYRMMRRLNGVVAERLLATLLQLMDIYQGAPQRV
jgi:CRP-like cAMP-binding protein